MKGFKRQMDTKETRTLWSKRNITESLCSIHCIQIQLHIKALEITAAIAIVIYYDLPSEKLPNPSRPFSQVDDIDGRSKRNIPTKKLREVNGPHGQEDIRVERI